MRTSLRCLRISILCLLCVSLFVPVFLLSHRLKPNSDASEEFVEDLSNIKHRAEQKILNELEQEESEDDADSLRDNATTDDINKHRKKKRQEDELPVSEEESHMDAVPRDQDLHTLSKGKVKEMKDQVIRAKVYLNFISADSSSDFVKELKLRIKELERAMSQSIEASSLSRSALQKIKAMESTLLRASHMYPDCPAMVKKLCAMTYNAEQQVRSQRNLETFLKGLGTRTIPKGLQCLSMRLTAEYFALEPDEKEFPNKHKLHLPDHYHFAIFSNNLLGCSVVVNSTISTTSEAERIVFHIVTDSLNFPAMSMWFLSNPPSIATVNVESIDNFQWLSTKYDINLQKEGSVDPRYISELNHLRFYLPDIFPRLNKIVLLDHEVVVQRDLTRLWRIHMGGKVNGAVQTCDQDHPSYRRMDMFINFTDPMIANKFDAEACTWAFGMNIFDLKEWRWQNLTEVYHKYHHLGNSRSLWKAGSLPIGWILFYGHTLALDKRWHLVGLGYDYDVRQEDINDAAVVHFDGIYKPWLEMVIEKYKDLWEKHVNYEHPYLQQCYIQQ